MKNSEFVLAMQNLLKQLENANKGMDMIDEFYAREGVINCYDSMPLIAKLLWNKKHTGKFLPSFSALLRVFELETGTFLIVRDPEEFYSKSNLTAE